METEDQTERHSILAILLPLGISPGNARHSRFITLQRMKSFGPGEASAFSIVAGGVKVHPNFASSNNLEQQQKSCELTLVAWL